MKEGEEEGEGKKKKKKKNILFIVVNVFHYFLSLCRRMNVWLQ